jgi:hypothetical protein
MHIATPKSERLDNKQYLHDFAVSEADAYVSQVLADLDRLQAAGAAPGAVDLDIEVSDAILGVFMRAAVNAIRERRKTYLLRINHAPNKQGFLPVDLLQNDPYLYVAYQLYYGDMSQVFAWDALRKYLAARIPLAKCHPCGGFTTVAWVRQQDGSFAWERVSNVPNVWWQGNKVSQIPGPSTWFSENLLFDSGLSTL